MLITESVIFLQIMLVMRFAHTLCPPKKRTSTNFETL